MRHCSQGRAAGGTFNSVAECGQALSAIEANKYDVIVVAWREFDDLAGCN
jgi:hypothetical protein